MAQIFCGRRISNIYLNICGWIAAIGLGTLVTYGGYFRDTDRTSVIGQTMSAPAATGTVTTVTVKKFKYQHYSRIFRGLF